MARRRNHPAPTIGEVTAPHQTGGTRRAACFGLGAILLIAATYATLEACSRQPEASASAFCTQMTVVRGLDRALAEQDLAELRRLGPELQKLEQASPAEIRPQVEVLVAFTGDVVSAIESTRQLPPDDQARALEEIWRSRQGELVKVQAAGRSVEAYTSATCGVDLTGTTRRGAPQTGSGPGTTR